MGARDRLLGIAGRAVLRASGVEVKETPTDRAAMTAGYVPKGTPISAGGWDLDRAVKDGMERVIWVAKPVDAIASKLAEWPIRVMEGNEPDWREVKDPLADILNGRANAVDGAGAAFRYRLYSQLLLSKKGAFIEVVPSRGGDIAALALLHPSRVQPIPGGDFVSAYRITYPNGNTEDMQAYDPKRKKGVVWARRHHVADPFSSWTPLEAAGISIDLDYDLRVYNQNFMRNDGRPGQIVAVKGQLHPDDARELKMRFTPGLAGAGRTSVIEAEAVTVSDTSASPRDAQYAELRGITKEDLLIALGTPESVLGNASGRTFDNADAERESWLLDTVIGLARTVNNVFDVLTEGGLDDDRRVWHDFSGEPVLQRSQRLREDRAMKELEAGAITIDEYREVAGRDPIGRPASRVLWAVTQGKKAIGDEKDEKELAEAAAAATPPALAAAAGGKPGQDEEQADLGELEATPAAAGEAAVDAEVEGRKDLPALESKAALKKGGKGGGWNPKQPRYPTGHPKGGQWMDEADVALWRAGKPLKGGHSSLTVKDPETGKVGTPTSGPNSAAAAKAAGAAPGASEAPSGPKPKTAKPAGSGGKVKPGTYKHSTGNNLVVAEDGTGKLVNGDGKVSPKTYSAESVAKAQADGKLTPLSTGPDVDSVADDDAPSAKPAGKYGTPNEHLLGGAEPEDILEHPADYPYVKVPGAAPAKTLKAPKKFKAKSLRKGDVINVGGKNRTVTAVKKGKQKDTLLLSLDDGNGEVDDDMPFGQDVELDVVARTPQPMVAAAAKKALAAKQAAAAGGDPDAPVAPGKYVGGDLQITVGDDGDGYLQVGGDPKKYPLPAEGIAQQLASGSFEKAPDAPAKPAAGLYTMPGNDTILAVGDDGSATFYYGVGDSQSYSAEEFADLAAGWDGPTGEFALDNTATIPEPSTVPAPSAGSVFKHPYTENTLIVQPDGSGVITSSVSGATTEVGPKTVEMLTDPDVGTYMPLDDAPAPPPPGLPESATDIEVPAAGVLFPVDQDATSIISAEELKPGDIVVDQTGEVGPYLVLSVGPGEEGQYATTGTYLDASGHSSGQMTEVAFDADWSLDVAQNVEPVTPLGDPVPAAPAAPAATGASAPGTPPTDDQLENAIGAAGGWQAVSDLEAYSDIEVGDVIVSFSTVDGGEGDGSIATYVAAIDVDEDGWPTFYSDVDKSEVIGDGAEPPNGEATVIKKGKLDLTVPPPDEDLLALMDSLPVNEALEAITTTGQVKPKPVVKETWTHPDGSTIEVLDNGNGVQKYPTGYTDNLDAAQLDYMLTTGPWTQQGAAPAAPAAPAYDPSAPGAILDYPPDYDYPIVDGAPAAVKLKKPKVFKPVSLRPGDVVIAGEDEVPYSVTKTKKGPDGTWQVWGKAETTGDAFLLGTYEDDTQIPVIARTPGPMAVAAAKKEKVAAGLPPTPVVPGAVSAADALTPPYAGTPTPASPTAPQGPSSSLPDEPAPVSITPGVVVASKPGPSAIAAAKPKKVTSAYAKAGAVVVLDDGEVVQLAGKPKFGTNDAGDFGLYVDAFPTSTTSGPGKWAPPGKTPGTVSISLPLSGQISIIPKGSLKGWQPVVAPSPHAMPTAPASAPDVGVSHVTTQGWKQVGPQGGSNLGGLFEAPDGTRFYVKSPQTTAHAQNEVLAGRFYKAAGVTVPETSITTLTPGVLNGSGTGVASKIVDGKKDLSAKYADPAYRDALYEDFAVHAWLANWDAVGLTMDNIITGADGKPVMVDAGGSLLYRAQGSPKGEQFGTEVGELQSMRTMGSAGQVYGGLTPDGTDARYVAGVKKVLGISPAQIDAMVEQSMSDLSPAERLLLKSKLKARREHLAKTAGLELPENVIPPFDLTTTKGGTPRPYSAGYDKPEVEEIVVDGKSTWFHTATFGAKSVKPGDVIYFDGDPSAPYVITKIGPKGGVSGKPALFGQQNGTGPEKVLFQVESSSLGERKVRVQIDPPPGWQPPPPPPPPVPGEKLVPREFGGTPSPGAPSKIVSMNQAGGHSRNALIGQGYLRATPEQKEALKSLGITTPAAFGKYFGDLSGNWNGTSNDSHVKMLAFHRATQIEFGLTDTFEWPSESGMLKKQVDDFAKQHQAAFQAASRLMWQQTQEVLKAKGIDYVQVWRGMSFSKQNTPAYATSPGVKKAPLRPLSSFAVQKSSAFHGMKVAGKVPREMIFSIFATGFGTDYENEAVIIGVGEVEWNIIPDANLFPEFFDDKQNLLPQYQYLETKDLKVDEPALADDDAPESRTGAIHKVPLATVNPSDETEDWLKGTVWPYVDEDGDDVEDIGEMADLYPDVNLRAILRLPVARAMPERLHGQIREYVDELEQEEAENAAINAELAGGGDGDDVEDQDDAPELDDEDDEREEAGVKTARPDDDTDTWVGLGG